LPLRLVKRVTSRPRGGAATSMLSVPRSLGFNELPRFHQHAHFMACIHPACRWIATHVPAMPASASGHRWLGSPTAEESSLAIVSCAGHHRQAHYAANIPPTCLMLRRESPRLWVRLSARSPTPTGASGDHSNSVGGTTLVSADWHVRLVLNTRVSKAAWCQFPALNTIEIEDRTGAKASAMALDKALFSV
jgi:hypothetical protein